MPRMEVIVVMNLTMVVVVVVTPSKGEGEVLIMDAVISGHSSVLS